MQLEYQEWKKDKIEHKKYLKQYGQNLSKINDKHKTTSLRSSEKTIHDKYQNLYQSLNPKNPLHIGISHLIEKIQGDREKILKESRRKNHLIYRRTRTRITFGQKTSGHKSQKPEEDEVKY